MTPDVTTAALESNWIPDLNRYGLPKPPAWFLQAMWDQDAALVIIPSRQARKYILARRRERSLTIVKINDSLTLSDKTHARAKYLDGDMLEGLKLVGVDSLIGQNMHGTWDPGILARLKSRDMWAAEGGVDGYIRKIETEEFDRATKKRAALLDTIEQQAKDSWRSYQARTGQRNHHAKNAKVGNRPRSGSIAGSGSVVVVPSFVGVDGALPGDGKYLYPKTIA